MNEDTPRTDEWLKHAEDGHEFVAHCRELERENAALMEVYKLDTDWLKAENDTLKAANSDVRRIAMERNEIERENAALRDALRSRIEDTCCVWCDAYLPVDGEHAETCRHYETERKVMGGEPEYAPSNCSPRRIQRKRTKGWRMPENTVSVCRPGKWGNPFVVSNFTTPQACVNHYEWFLRERCAGMRVANAARRELRGKNLACFCPLDQPCHADVLLRVANASGQPRLADNKKEV